MNLPTRSWLPAVAGALLLAPGAGAQQGDAADGPAPARFKTPVRIAAGDALLGEGRLYPSPAVRDVDGDGCMDLVIGDLRGVVTWARGTDAERPTFAAEKPMLLADGRPLKFHNW